MSGSSKTSINYFDPFSSESLNPKPVIKSAKKENTTGGYFDPFSSESVPNHDLQSADQGGRTEETGGGGGGGRKENARIHGYFDPFSSEPLSHLESNDKTRKTIFRNNYFDPFSSEQVNPKPVGDSAELDRKKPQVGKNVNNNNYFDPFSSLDNKRSIVDSTPRSE